MVKKLILFPFGGNARESLLSVLALNKLKKQWDPVGFVDDDRLKWGKECCGIKVLGDKGVLKKYPDAWILAVPGNPDNYPERKSIIDSLGVENSRFATIIHPSAVISPDARIGYDTTIMPNVVITCGARIGNHCIILPNTSILHDSKIGDYSCVGSNVSISARVNIASASYIGSGTKIKGDIRIGEGALVGLGSNVIFDIEKGTVAAGNPAKTIRKTKK